MRWLLRLGEGRGELGWEYLGCGGRGGGGEGGKGEGDKLGV